MESLMDLLGGIYNELESLKLTDINVYDSGGKSILADYFFVSSADSIVQLEAVRNNLIRYMKKFKTYLRNSMEEWHGGWCLLDFGDIIIHIFLEERRSFFQIDRLMESSGYALIDVSVPA
jgi:ribosome-associated protein